MNTRTEYVLSEPQAGAITGKAHLEADSIRGRAYQQLHCCLKELES